MLNVLRENKHVIQKNKESQAVSIFPWLCIQQKFSVKRNSSETKNYILYGSIYIKLTNEQNNPW